MGIGDKAEASVRSYVAMDREVTYGTYTTNTTALTAVEALSCSFKTNIKSIKLPAITTNRGFSRRVMTDKEVGGTLETYGHPNESILVLVSGLGGALSTTTLSTGAYSHVLNAGNFGSSIPSVCFNVRKGSAQTWRYSGGRVNTLKLSAEVGDMLKISADYIFKDSTQVSDDQSANLSLTSHIPFSFEGGAFTYSGVSEKITGFELSINNNLVSDKNARALGQNTLQVLPALRRDVEFKITQRMDTTTTWTRFTSGTNAAAQLVFTGATLTAANTNKLTIDLPKVFYQTPDVELSSPDEILMSDINYDVVVDAPHTSTGYDVKVTVINDVTTY
ncbi:MAG: hypothetical protein KAJ48_08040 [Elusimicrobiales bacterium]|nr:hypothetical protein [Elusimicrobiales bacterium]